MANEVDVVTKRGRSPSLQVVQDVYNDLTGKTERTARIFYDSHVASLADLENLHHSIEQSLEQYDCKASNCSIGVRLCDGKSERFSSFSKFKTQGTNRSRATVGVELEYDFLIVLPKTLEAKPYKVAVGLMSGLGVIEGFKHTNASATEQSMYFELHSGTARLEILYVDLAVARSLEAVVEDWYRGLTKVNSSRFSTEIRKNSRWIPALVRSALLGSMLGFSYYLTHSTVGTNANLYRAFLISAAVSGIALSFAVPVASRASRIIDRSRPSSAVVLSKVDQELLDAQKSGPVRAVLKVLGQGVAVVIMGLITTYVAIKLGMT
jgi:hypothetical protein